MKINLGRIVAAICAGAILHTGVYAANIGVCTHMTAKHTGETPDRITELAKDVGTEWIRDELRWGWGMQTTPGGEFKMPAGDWTDKIEEAGINSLLILGFGNSIYNRDGIEDKDEEYIPTPEHTDYFNAWKEYVKFTAQNCKGKVDAYEVWNEPNPAPFNYQLSKDRYSYSASDYAELLIATREVLDVYDPDAKVIGGSILLGGTVTSGWAEELFKTLNARGGANKYMDGFSFHVYSYDSTDKETAMRSGLNRMERVMDSYGFTGEAWLTETGYYTGTADNAVSDQEYASLVIRSKLIWDDYLKDNGRTGNYFWYVLRDTGGDKTVGGNNFGLASYGYKPKDGFYSAKAYNTILKDKEFVYMTESTDGNDFIALYNNENSDTTDKVYVIFKKGNYSSEIQIPLSGDAAYVYDYKGNFVKKETAETLSLELKDTSPVFVRCVDYTTTIDNVEYDSKKNICTVTGMAEYMENVTLELLKDGVAVQTETVNVNSDGTFEKLFQPNEDGRYTLRLGKAEVEEIGGKSWAEKEVLILRDGTRCEEIAVTYESEETEQGLRVNLSGTVSNDFENELLTLLLLPEGSTSIKDAVYAGDVRTGEKGEFSISFVIPKKTPHMYHYTMYIRGTQTELNESSVDYITGKGDVLAYDFTLNLSDNQFTASAYVRNMTEDEKKPIMFIAQYNSDGILINVEKTEIEADGTKKLLTLSVKKNENTKKCRAYIWNGAGTMNPIAPTIDRDLDYEKGEEE